MDYTAAHTLSKTPEKKPNQAVVLHVVNNFGSEMRHEEVKHYADTRE